MLSQYYTLQELQQMKFYELPSVIYKAILEDIRKTIGILTKRIIEILNNAPVFQLDQYTDIYKFIKIIA